MQELLDIQQYCLDKMHQHLACGGECPINHYCIQRDCNEGNCSECLHHIMRSPDPSFHYKCKRITYHYMLRYTNRFASEITHLVSLFDLSALNKINIVSIGSGPASELWGFLKAFELQTHPIPINYLGYDLNPIWSDIQDEIVRRFEQTPHNVKFFHQDIFDNFDGFPNDESSILVLNYVLSDLVKYQDLNVIEEFLQSIVNLVLRTNIKRILFNDINYYGYPKYKDSGTQLMKSLLVKLKQNGVGYKVGFFYFQGDPYRGSERWVMHETNSNLFRTLEGNTYLDNVLWCRSKQIFVQLT